MGSTVAYDPSHTFAEFSVASSCSHHPRCRPRHLDARVFEFGSSVEDLLGSIKALPSSGTVQVQSVWRSRTYLMHRAWEGSRDFIEFALAVFALGFVVAVWAEDGLWIAAPVFALLLLAIRFWNRYLD
jgi:hypothetical protein